MQILEPNAYTKQFKKPKNVFENSDSHPFPVLEDSFKKGQNRFDPNATFYPRPPSLSPIFYNKFSTSHILRRRNCTNGELRLHTRRSSFLNGSEAFQRLLLLNAVIAKVRLTNKSHKTISRIFCIVGPGDYVQLAWRILSRPLQIIHFQPVFNH